MKFSKPESSFKHTTKPANIKTRPQRLDLKPFQSPNNQRIDSGSEDFNLQSKNSMEQYFVKDFQPFLLFLEFVFLLPKKEYLLSFK